MSKPIVVIWQNGVNLFQDNTYLGILRFHLTIVYFKFVLALTTKKEPVRCILIVP